MPDQATQPPPRDFNLTPPAEQPAHALPVNPVPSIAAPATTTGTPIGAAGLATEGGLSATGAVLGLAILLVLAVASVFVRAALRGHLIAQRASPSAAGNAGWALFAFLLSLSVLIVFGLIGDLWHVAAFTLPLLLLVAVTLVLFVLLYRAAAGGRPARRR